MKALKLLNFLFFGLLIACSSQTSSSIAEKATSDSAYKWTKVLDSGPWKKSYNFQLFSHGDSLWVFHPDGNWYSTDGKNWTKSTLTNAIYNLAFLSYVQFNKAIYGLGHFEGNIEKFTFEPKIYQTTDLKNWKVIAGKSNLPERFFSRPFVFADKIWMIGGQDKENEFADIWNSVDGVNWVKQKDNLPFGKRRYANVVNLKGKLYLIGKDVWTSTDALNWEKLTDEIITGENISGFTPIVFEDKIWLLGCSREGLFSSQVLMSSDGKNWEMHNAPWSPRVAMAVVVFKNKIYLTGGKYGGTPNAPDFRYSNDLWTLERK